GVSARPSFEILGIVGGKRTNRNASKKVGKKLKKLNLNVSLGSGMTYNSRRGYEWSLAGNFVPFLEISDANQSKTPADLAIEQTSENSTKPDTIRKTIGLGLGFSFSPSSGFDIAPSIGLPRRMDQINDLELDLTAGYNSRRGLRSLTYQGVYRKKDTYSMRNSPSFDLGPYDYIPTSPLPLQNNSFIFNATLGGEIVGIHPNLNVEGFYSKQKLAYKTESQKAVGYLHLDKANPDPRVVLDYNSEVSGVISKNIPNLPISYGTPDIFNIAGQGISGQFSASRNDLGIFRPSAALNTSVSGKLGASIGFGGILHSGFSGQIIESNTSTGVWRDNRIANHLVFQENEDVFEAVSLKSTGGLAPIPSGVFSTIGGVSPARVDNFRVGQSLVAGSKYRVLSQSGGTYNDALITAEVKNTERPVRGQAIRYLTGAEAAQVGLDKQIKDYPENTLVYTDCNQNLVNAITRTQYADDHISEIEVTQGDGSRYIYGLPVYNTKRREVSFTVNQNNYIQNGTFNPSSDQYGLVTYNPQSTSPENSINNDRGKEKYFNATELPPYAHSYLLTGLVSDDYVDKTGDGITEDDL
ncbi:MAG: hypothetical protein AAF242_19420, partial [Bacteroidota bacterium]